MALDTTRLGARDGKEDFRRLDRDPPSDRVLTVMYEEHVASSFSPMTKDSRQSWSSEDEKLIEELQAKFGPAPRRL